MEIGGKEGVIVLGKKNERKMAADMESSGVEYSRSEILGFHQSFTEVNTKCSEVGHVYALFFNLNEHLNFSNMPKRLFPSIIHVQSNP
jgi:hypothetical protein